VLYPPGVGLTFICQANHAKNTHGWRQYRASTFPENTITLSYRTVETPPSTGEFLFQADYHTYKESSKRMSMNCKPVVTRLSSNNKQIHQDHTMAIKLTKQTEETC
jgi:hypothetical protein